MEISLLLLGLAFFVAHFFSATFPITKVPDVLLLMVAGILIGPVFGLVKAEDFGTVGGIMAAMALVLILFESGTTLDLKELQRALGLTLGLTLGSFVLTLALGWAFAFYVLQIPLFTALAFGAAIGGTSSAVVIPLVKALKLSPKIETVLIMESALTDVLCIVFTMSFVQAAGTAGFEVGRLVGTLLASFFFALCLGILGALVWLLLLKTIRGFPNTILSTLAFLLILYGVTEFLGFSGGIAALAFGFGLANQKSLGFHHLKPFLRGDLTELTETERSFFSETAFVFKTFFFLYLGITLPFGQIHLILGALFLLGILYLLRLVLTRAGVSSELPLKDRIMTSLMIPKGLAAAILATVPLQKGLVGGETVRDLTYMVVFFSILITSVLVFLSDKGPFPKWYGLALGKELPPFIKNILKDTPLDPKGSEAPPDPTPEAPAPRMSRAPRPKGPRKTKP